MSNAKAREAHALLKTDSSTPVGAQGYVGRLSSKIQDNELELAHHHTNSGELELMPKLYHQQKHKLEQTNSITRKEGRNEKKSFSIVLVCSCIFQMGEEDHLFIGDLKGKF